MSDSKLSIRPLGDRVIVKSIEQAEKTSGGIYLPDTAKEKPQQGVVVAAGAGRKNDKGELIPMEVAVGNRVLYGKYSGTEVKIEGETYLIIKESEVLAILG